MDRSDKKALDSSRTRDLLKELIDGYKYGKLSAEETCRKAEDLLGSYTVFYGKDEDLKRTVEEILPETIRAFRETEDDQQRLLDFWKGLKDCDHLLYFGRTFTEEIEEYLTDGMDRADPVEYTDRFLAIEPELEKLIREEIGEGGYLGFCHRYWGAKKRILKERFGIDWKSTADRFPGVMFD
jgi:hypothetical protein